MDEQEYYSFCRWVHCFLSIYISCSHLLHTQYSEVAIYCEKATKTRTWM